METNLLNNRYRINQTIGRGGFGETFLAVDTHMPSERQCVIKQLKPAIQPPEEWVKDRFQREAAILEELGENNRQIPRLYAYFTEGGDFYLVQEWIEGVNLREKIIKDGVLSEAEVTDILMKLLPVLEYTHKHKIIHRDIKPENIILRQSNHQPVLIDFGAVKEAIITQAYQNSNSLSIAIGTPGYMSSEQAAGRPLYSSDLYSLGLTAIYLLTGKPPQELEIDSQTGEILWRQQAPNLHSNLASVIDRSIRFHPRDRFQSAQEMFNALTASAESPSQKTQVVVPTYNPKQEIPTGGTLVLDHPYLKETNTQAVKLGLPLFLIGGGVAIAAFTLAFTVFLSRNRSVPVVNQETPSPSTTVVELPPLQPHISTNLEPPAAVKPIPEATKVVPLTPPIERTEKPPTPPVVTTSEVPVFSIGSQQQDILQALGDPNSQQRGYWHNTMVWTYRDNVPGVEVKYLFDTKNEKLRQSEAIFADGTSLEVMEDTLNRLLGGKAPDSIQSALKAVYNNETDLRSFNYQDKKGMIRRDTKEQINIIVSAADFN